MAQIVYQGSDTDTELVPLVYLSLIVFISFTDSQSLDVLARQPIGAKGVGKAVVDRRREHLKSVFVKVS